jgi:hypothetical protein
MARTRNRLIAAARRSMLQRAELHRRLDVARAALKPSALIDRGKYRIGVKVDDTAHAVQEHFQEQPPADRVGGDRGNSMALPRTDQGKCPQAGRKIQDLAADVADHFRSADER